MVAARQQVSRDSGWDVRFEISKSEVAEPQRCRGRSRRRGRASRFGMPGGVTSMSRPPPPTFTLLPSSTAMAVSGPPRCLMRIVIIQAAKTVANRNASATAMAAGRRRRILGETAKCFTLTLSQLVASDKRESGPLNGCVAAEGCVRPIADDAPGSVPTKRQPRPGGPRQARRNQPAQIAAGGERRQRLGHFGRRGVAAVGRLGQQTVQYAQQAPWARRSENP